MQDILMGLFIFDVIFLICCDIDWMCGYTSFITMHFYHQIAITALNINFQMCARKCIYESLRKLIINNGLASIKTIAIKKKYK